MHKKAVIGKMISLFLATIVIVIFIAVVTFGSTAYIYFTEQKTGVDSVLLLSADDYMQEYKVTISNQSLYGKGNTFVVTRFFTSYGITGDDGALIEGDLLDETTVRSSCTEYPARLLFMSGVYDAWSGTGLDDSPEACTFILDYLQKEDPYEPLYQRITSFKVSRLDDSKEVFCCYGS